MLLHLVCKYEMNRENFNNFKKEQVSLMMT